MKQQITQALQDFSSTDLRSAATALLNTLGYASEKTLELSNAPEAFLEQFGRDDIAKWEQKALFEQWQTVDLLFQLTDDELTDQAGLFDNTAVDTGLMRSYLFFALELKGENYARGKLTAIARQINRLFPTPVMVLIKHSENGKPVLSIAVINRRQNKREADRDVLGKVTIIRNISLEQPHRGHLNILASFAAENLPPLGNFDELHAAWEEVFNVELLNKRFYRELSNWYFWAMQKVRFPYDELKENADQLDKNGLFQDEEKIKGHDAKNLIRLLTRLLFVWFIKEKHLVPEELFEEDELQGDILKDFKPRSDATRYYKAILQNLFFATLNQTHGKREFRKKGQHRNTTTLMRYEEYFQDPAAFISLVEDVVPFMNGGLFECLDKPHPSKKGPQGGDVILYEDGFSDRPDNILAVPDELFFGGEQSIDLSDVYGDTKRRREKVRGIIPILNSYKFTIVENTPIDQEIALDPELLGKVFENLLASYNPETKTTARKQTGSFYTPRTIVDYMVDESLIAYLAGRLSPDDQSDQSDRAHPRLRQLLSYTDEPHDFAEDEVLELIEAIDKCKILDPACGSGAFPMGILHKLEFILAKLDPQNRLWRDRQIEKVDATIAAAERIDDARAREEIIANAEAQKRDIEDAFANNELGYGRKLYLIENCIYGVDIQSIATQVSKLRFFISLIVDQRVHPDQANFGIRALPNLETKFATANTLIQVEKPQEQMSLFDSAKVKELERELKKVRHAIFSAKTPKTKNNHRARDKELREQIAAELQTHGLGNETARQLANWDPYDQNASAPFFDPEWMFDVQGFDIVIGNPPYVRAEAQVEGNKKQREAILESKQYETLWEKWDLYIPFIERSYKLLNPNGVSALIVSDAFCHSKYAQKSQQWLLEHSRILRLDFLSKIKIFDAAVRNVIPFLQNADGSNWEPTRRLHEESFGNVIELTSDAQQDLTYRAFFPEDNQTTKYTGNTTPLLNICYISYGLRPCSDYKKAKGLFTSKDMISNYRDANHSKPFVEAKDMYRYFYLQHRWLEWDTERAPLLFARPTFPQLYTVPEKIMASKVCGEDIRCAYDNSQILHNDSIISFVPWHMLQGVTNRSIKKTAQYSGHSRSSSNLPTREHLETHSQKFAVKFLLGVLNSKTIRDYLRDHRRSNVQLYPDDWKDLPIPDVPKEKQQPVIELVDQILEAKRADQNAETSELESRIDNLVRELYGIDDEKEKITAGKE